MDRIVEVVVTDLADHFGELDDTEEAGLMFGDYARVTVEGNVLTVLHETLDSGITVTVERFGGDASGADSGGN